MPINEKTDITRGEIIEMVACRFDYGHTNQIADDFFWCGLGKELSEVEIAEYTNDLLQNPQYTKEDEDQIIKVVTEWRDEMMERYK